MMACIDCTLFIAYAELPPYMSYDETKAWLDSINQRIDEGIKLSLGEAMEPHGDTPCDVCGRVYDYLGRYEVLIIV